MKVKETGYDRIFTENSKWSPYATLQTRMGAVLETGDKADL
jgi:hypothetical protein